MGDSTVTTSRGPGDTPVCHIVINGIAEQAGQLPARDHFDCGYGDDTGQDGEEETTHDGIVWRLWPRTMRVGRDDYATSTAAPNDGQAPFARRSGS